MRLGDRAPARATVQSAEAQIAMGEEWPHAELLAEGGCLAIGGFRLLSVLRLRLRGDLAEQAERVGFAAALFMAARKLERVPRGGGRLTDAAGREVGLAQPRDQNRVFAHPLHRDGVAPRVLQ